MFISWCERRSCVVEAPGTPRLVGTAEANARAATKRKNRNEEECADGSFCSSVRASDFARTRLGKHRGRVTDPAGASVAGAQARATQEGTGFSRTATTDTEGLYVIPSLQPATYTLTVEAKGFSTSKESAITLLADQTLTVNVGLKLGITTEVVTVASNAVQVDTSTSVLKQVIEQQRISELPSTVATLRSSPYSWRVPSILPTAVPTKAQQRLFPALSPSQRMARGRIRSAINLTEAITLTNTRMSISLSIPDALQEFSVQTSNYSAEYGSNAGGVVNVITKSGTNNFHGDAFEFNRNPAFNAQNYFATPTTPDRVKRNQFGGTLGGPIIRDKTFFFGGYQRTAFRNLVLGSQNVVG